MKTGIDSKINVNDLRLEILRINDVLSKLTPQHRRANLVFTLFNVRRI